MTRHMCVGQQAFKAEFDGTGTVFVPVLSPEEVEEGVKGRVVKYAEGLAHRMVLLEEWPRGLIGS